MFEDNFYLWLVGISLFFLWLWIRRIRKDIATMQADMQKVLGSILFMRIEKHEETLYAYNALNEEFICQGSSIEDLNKQFGQRYPNCKGIIVENPNTQEQK
jgi:hypothetical protein